MDVLAGVRLPSGVDTGVFAAEAPFGKTILKILRYKLNYNESLLRRRLT